GVNEGDLLVVTENGYGKRTKLADYPRKGRGGLGVKTAQLVKGKGRLVGARVVREGYQVMLISTAGTVIKMAVDDIKRSGRSTQGVIVMRFKAVDERVSALAPVVESDEEGADPDQGQEAADLRHRRPRDRDADQAGQGQGPQPRRGHRCRPVLQSSRLEDARLKTFQPGLASGLVLRLRFS